jgi:hypothetical protein
MKHGGEVERLQVTFIHTAGFEQSALIEWFIYAAMA